LTDWRLNKYGSILGPVMIYCEKGLENSLL